MITSCRCRARAWPSDNCAPALRCTPLHGAALHFTALDCPARHGTGLHCTGLHSPLHCTALHCTALHGTALLGTALLCSGRQRVMGSTAAAASSPQLELSSRPKPPPPPSRSLKKAANAPPSEFVRIKVFICSYIYGISIVSIGFRFVAISWNSPKHAA